jgi:uracil-DNA glycosylase family 4
MRWENAQKDTGRKRKVIMSEEAFKLPASRTLVPPTGRLDSQYVLVGEAPGKIEVRDRKPFVGPAGNELNRDLNSACISRPVCYITNVIKDLDIPTENYIQLYKNKRLLKEPIISEKGQQYIDFLRWELAQTSAKVFGAIGAISMYVLTGKVGITKWRGSILDCTLVEGRKVVPILHPATVIAPKYNYLNRRLIVFDLKRLNELASNLYVPTERELIIEPTFIQTMEFLEYCKTEGLRKRRVSYDIEVYMKRTHKEISCIAFAVGLRAICIPFADANGDYFLLNQEAEIWKKIAEILEHPGIRIVAQNITFDSHFLLRTYGICVSNLDDTMIAQNIILSDYPKGLHFITNLFTDHPYYKDDGKDFVGTSSENYKQYWRYNATDAIICSEAMPKQMEELERLKDTSIYNNQVRIIGPLVYMMERGIKVDVEGMQKLRSEYEQRINENQLALNLIVGEPLNAKSPKQLKDYFSGKKNIQPYKEKGAITYNDLAMTRLKRRGFKEAEYIQTIRRYTKLRSTYLDIAKIDEDGRWRCSFNPAGTRFSRLSSSTNIWGSGGNTQNIPHDLQEFFLPDDGYVYYAFDLEQAENRIVAYVGEIIEMIECFEKDVDVHARTGRMIMMSYYGEEKAREIDVRSISPLGDKTHTWRDYGKKANHGFNYSWSYKAFALTNELSEKDGKLIHDAYHKLYPGVQQNFHAYVRHSLRTTRSLNNLMGRKTLFMGALKGPQADSTFKEAYSCIPQGTVGDIINKRGLNYIYYNQDLFKPIELLRQVHDEVGFQIPLNVSWEIHAKMLLLIKKSLENPLRTHNGREFIIPAGLTVGKTLNKATGNDIENITAENLKVAWRELNDKN